MAKRSSKLLTGIIAFLLGFIFAILVEVGAIFGVYWYVTSTDLETVMSTIGIQNKDENGNNKYINTDPDNGGVTNIKELFAALQELVYEDGELAIIGKSFDDIETLIPATNMVLGIVYDAIGDYIELDKAEFEATPMSNLPQFLTDSIMDVKTASVMTKMGMDAFVGEDANGMIKAIVMGAECEYASVTYGEVSAVAEGDENEEPAPSLSAINLPVFYDVYDYNYVLENYGRKQYVRNSSGNTNRYPENLSEDLLCEMPRRDDDGNPYTDYVLYYVPCRVNLADNVIQEAVYSTKGIPVEVDGKTKIVEVLDYGADTEFIVVKPDANGNFVLNFDAVKAAHENCEEGQRHALQYYDEYGRTYYNTDKDGNLVYPLSTISGKNFFYDNAKQLVQINALTVGDIMEDPFKPLYSVSITSIIGEDSDVVAKLFGDYSVGELLDGKVPFDEIANDLQVSVFINNVKPDNKVMAYIVHRISDIEKKSNGTYTAVYDKFGKNETPVTVVLDTDGYIYQVVAPDGSVLEGVLVNEVAALTANMTVNLLMDVNADEPLMAYIGYGVTGVKRASAGAEDPNGEAYDFIGKFKVEGAKKDCYLRTQPVEDDGEPHIVTNVWYIDEEGKKVAVGGTKVNEVSALMSSITSDLTLSDVISLDESNQIINAIKDVPICDIGMEIQNLTVSDIFTEEEIERNAILRQLRNTHVDGLADAIDSLLIQTVYDAEVYGLPQEDCRLMEVIEFGDEARMHLLELVKQPDGKYEFDGITDGKITKAQYDNLDKNVVYYSYDDGEDLKIIGFNEKFIYYIYDEEAKTYKLADVNCEGLTIGSTAYDDQLGHLTKAQYDDLLAQGKSVYTYGEAKGMWRIVLYKGNREKAYTINNFNNMVNVCAANVYSAKLFELQEAGVIDATKDLTKSFNGQVLGEMTFAQLIDAVISLAS